MVRTPSTMTPLGSAAPDFSLPNVDGKTVSLTDFDDAPALLVMFMCNHCPFVLHLADALADFAREYEQRGLRIVGISSNDVENYPADSPELMKEEADKRGYVFPYLYDATQEVAKAYRAACTPDFFLYSRSGETGELELAYRGQFDSTRPDSGNAPTGADLRAACDAVLAEELPSEDQTPSLGCNIKWIAGNEPDYFG
ncbi:putative peroxiredoxin [Pseudobythopirellula maris]|uniref:Putative peroxiredoxin n=1 Tax=Pseudobythopirellula maris TaxID=2527991 RepID=A0A5C5ZP45_9BACT|nr:thioredoxin family protein [Pseudobythopirellula maris]TWT88541.1 putative peroxiredoxin [Pseudobythopirellula maris]